MRDDDREIREVSGHVVQRHRVGVLQADPASAPKAGADSGLATVKDTDRPALGEHFVDGIRHPVIGVEGLKAWVELKAPYPVAIDEGSGPTYRRRPLPRVHTGEWDQH